MQQMIKEKLNSLEEYPSVNSELNGNDKDKSSVSVLDKFTQEADSIHSKLQVIYKNGETDNS